MSSLVACGGDISLQHGVPYLLFPNDSNQVPNPLTGRMDNHVRFWVHVGLVCFGFLLSLVSLILQCWKPMPYGKLSDGDGSWMVPVRPAWIAAHLIPGFILFTITYFTGAHFDSPLNIVLYCIFVIHYLARGIISPLASKYSERRITIWVPIIVLITNAFYHYINAEFIGSVNYCRGYYYDPRFIFGAILLVIGFFINCAADIQLMLLRKSRNDRDYLIPKGVLFHLITCPNYFGEGLLWLGWAVMTWSLAGIVWWMFISSLLVSRARHSHWWYKNNFKNYPSHRKALLPFIY